MTSTRFRTWAALWAAGLGVMRALAAEDVLLADFEGADFGGWTVHGTAFGEAPARGTLPEQAAVGGFRGQGFVSSFHGRDRATGRLVSPEFTVSRRYLNFLIGGGEEVGATCVTVTVEGQPVRSATGREDEFLNQATFDLGEFLGRTVRIEIVDGFAGSWGHINADHFVLSDAAATPPFVQNPPPPPPYHDEPLRPQFHFTAHSNWLNDPNGLVRVGDQYHLFFQHNPTGREWGNMTWGHAVGTDLVRWKELSPALLPDPLGTMFSGSVVVDAENTAGFQTGKEPALVAIYTAAGGTSEASKGRRFTQCLAHSNDGGRTWIKYAGNPVMDAIGDDDRDPKAFWHAPTRRWVMPLYVGVPDPSRPDAQGKPAIRHTCQFFTSPDLKQWAPSGVFPEELSECPGLVSLPLSPAPGTHLWVLWGGDGAYWTGDFDGRSFTAKSGKRIGDYGTHFYAAQAWDALPNGRVVLIGWMRGGKYPGMPFNQQMSFPVDLSLERQSGEVVLVKWPVPEIRNLFTSVLREDLPKPFPPGTHRVAGDLGDLLDLELEFLPGSARTVSLEVRGQTFRWDAASATATAFGKSIPSPPVAASAGRRSEFPPPWGPDLKPWDGSVRWRLLVDRTSLELFVNGGLATASFCFLPEGPPALSLTVEGGDLAHARLVRRTLKSAWR
ncbi:MAG: glycoside hydrolase family 32 protein [Verrucomicrobia bacterium]|nr:glycoside hydrolase family 32 protein [Verrucomicrobiota bacterium]